MEEEYGTDTFERGVLGTIGGSACSSCCRSSGRYYDRLYRRDPHAALRLVGLADPAGRRAHAGRSTSCRTSCCSRSARHPAADPAVDVRSPWSGRCCSRSSRTGCAGMGAALGSIYIFFIGATGGALLSALLTDAFGPRAAVLVARDPVDDRSAGYLIIRSAHVHPQRPVAGGRRAPGGDGGAPAPARGARVGPRAAGRRRRLLVRAGAGALRRRVRGRGAARCSRCSARTARASRRSSARSPASARRRAASCACNGRTITYTTPEQRARLGIRILLGGKGVFPAMTVHENLEMAAFVYRGDRADFRRRLDRAYDLFPALARTRAARRVARCRAASSRCSRWRWCCCTTPRCSPSTSSRSASRRVVVQELLARDRAAEGRRDDDHHRRAVAERRARGRRPGGVPREGAGALQRARRPSSPSATTSPARCSSAPKAADRRVVATWITSQLVFNGVGRRARDRAARDGHRARSTGRRGSSTSRSATWASSARACSRCSSSTTACRSGSRRLARWSSARCSARSWSWSSIRRLFSAPRVIVLVATIGIAGLALAIVTAYPEIDDVGAALPGRDRHDVDDVVGVRVTGPQLAVLVVVPIVALALGVVPQPHAARPHGQGVGREPRPGAARRASTPRSCRPRCGRSPASSPRSR